MKNLLKISLGILITILTLIGYVSSFSTVHAQANGNTGSTGSYSPFKVLNGVISPQSTAWTLKFPYLGGNGTRCIQVDDNGLFAVASAACGSGGGGSGGGSWSTTTSTHTGRLINYPNNTTDIVVIGGTATTTASTEVWFDPNTENYKIGSSNTASTTIMGIFNLPTLTAGGLYIGSAGKVNTVATSTPTVTSPITYSGTLGSFLGGSSGAFACATCAVTGTTLTVGGTTNQITSSAGAQDLSTNRTWTLSFPNLIVNPQASTTLFSNFATAYFGGSATTTISSNGSITMPSGSTFTKTGVSDGCATWATGVLGTTGVACGSGGSASAYEIATSSNIALSQVAYISQVSGRTTIASAATSSIGAGTGLTFSGTAGAQIGGTNGTYSVNTSQNIATLSNLTTNGVVYTAGSAGTLNVSATSTPTVTAPITYSGTLGDFLKGASGTFGCISASAGVTGCLTGTDWSTFNAKLSSYDAYTHSTINTPNSATTTKQAIGTTTPYYSFTVASSTGPQVALSDGISGDPQVTLRNAGGNLYIATTTVAGTSTTTSAALSIIGSSGFTGIGTSTPTATLDVFAGSQTAPYFAIGSTTAPIASIGPSATTYVAIGTTTPWRTLSVVGTLAVNGLSVVTGKNSVCIDATTKEILDSGSTTCSLSSGFSKDIIEKITPEVAKYIVDRMNAITFNYKGETEQHYGFIAEEAAKIDADVKAKFGVDAHLAEYANTDVNMKLGDGTYHFFKKGDPINFQYPNYTAVLTVYLQSQQNNFDQKINDQNKLIQNLIDAVKLIVQLKK